jgi:hypothetical protein
LHVPSGGDRLTLANTNLGKRLDLLELVAVCDAVGMPLNEFVSKFEKARELQNA